MLMVNITMVEYIASVSASLECRFDLFFLHDYFLSLVSFIECMAISAGSVERDWIYTPQTPKRNSYLVMTNIVNLLIVTV